VEHLTECHDNLIEKIEYQATQIHLGQSDIKALKTLILNNFTEGDHAEDRQEALAMTPTCCCPRCAGSRIVGANQCLLCNGKQPCEVCGKLGHNEERHWLRSEGSQGFGRGLDGNGQGTLTTVFRYGTTEGKGWATECS
jgi:hypothetical protein